MKYLAIAPVARVCAIVALATGVALLAGEPAHARKKKRAADTEADARPAAPRNPGRDGEAEARLIEVYRLVGSAQSREALQRARELVRDHPNFQLAQLVYGDLLSAQTRPVRTVGDVPDTTARVAGALLADLRDESQMRIKALLERPPPDTVPSQFLALSSRNKHAIAVDASRSRLYLFENVQGALKLVADYYVSVGKSGIEKAVEGDLRTPLGVYFITSNVDRRTLRDFYGAGALPINYPNAWDTRRGKTGGGIWLHGTPPGQFSRAPKATDGCVALANPDLERIINTVEIRTTPVVIAQRLEWVPQQAVQPEGRRFEATLAAWRTAKTQGSLERLLEFYDESFAANGRKPVDRRAVLREELDRVRGREIALKDVSLLRWTDDADTMVVTFGEVPEGARNGVTRRQYWMRQGGQWKIFYEGSI